MIFKQQLVGWSSFSLLRVLLLLACFLFFLRPVVPIILFQGLTSPQKYALLLLLGHAEIQPDGRATTSSCIRSWLLLRDCLAKGLIIRPLVVPPSDDVTTLIIKKLGYLYVRIAAAYHTCRYGGIFLKWYLNSGTSMSRGDHRIEGWVVSSRTDLWHLGEDLGILDSWGPWVYTLILLMIDMMCLSRMHHTYLLLIWQKSTISLGTWVDSGADTCTDLDSNNIRRVILWNLRPVWILRVDYSSYHTVWLCVICLIKVQVI